MFYRAVVDVLYRKKRPDKRSIHLNGLCLSPSGLPLKNSGSFGSFFVVFDWIGYLVVSGAALIVNTGNFLKVTLLLYYTKNTFEFRTKVM